MASPENTFTCLTHPSISIPHSRINDDYCDCPDGSDEPGTAACSHLAHANVAIPGFYCRNEKHVPAYLPLSRVNDGICDYDLCCDGADEYAGVAGVKCENRCGEIGKAARVLQEQRQRLRSDGMKVRAELVARAKVLRRELEDDLKATAAKIEGVARNVKVLEKALKETEEKERLRLGALKKAKEGSKMGTLVLAARERSEELKRTLEKVKRERNSAIERLSTAEGILEALKEGYNPNFNDEGVKTAVRAWEEYLAQDISAQKPSEEEDSSLEALLSANPVDWDEFFEGNAEKEDCELSSSANGRFPPTDSKRSVLLRNLSTRKHETLDPREADGPPQNARRKRPPSSEARHTHYRIQRYTPPFSSPNLLLAD